MREETLELAKMMSTLSPTEKNNFIALLDRCPVLNVESLSEKEKKTGVIIDENLKKFSLPKISIVLKLRKSLVEKNSELSALTPAPYIDTLTPIIGQGVSDYLCMSEKERVKFKNIVCGTKKSRIISYIRQMHQGIRN